MVGTMKRYDPAYERLAELMPGIRADVRLVRVTTLESPFEPYVAHYPLLAGARRPRRSSQELRRADERGRRSRARRRRRRTRAGATAGFCSTTSCTSSTRCAACSASRRRSCPPTSARECVSVNLRFGETECHLSWVDLPGIARYKQEFAFYAPEQRLTLELPSPFLRNEPSRLIVGGRRARHRAQLGARGDRLLRRGVQAGARGVRRLHRDRRASRVLRGRRAGRYCGSARPSPAPTRAWTRSSSRPPRRRPTRHEPRLTGKSDAVERASRIRRPARCGRRRWPRLARVAVANAPVSYGAFEITVGMDPNVPEPLTLLDWVHQAGYAGHRPRAGRLPR